MSASDGVSSASSLFLNGIMFIMRFRSVRDFDGAAFLDMIEHSCAARQRRRRQIPLAYLGATLVGSKNVVLGEVQLVAARVVVLEPNNQPRLGTIDTIKGELAVKPVRVGVCDAASAIVSNKRGSACGGRVRILNNNFRGGLAKRRHNPANNSQHDRLGLGHQDNVRDAALRADAPRVSSGRPARTKAQRRTTV